MFFFATADAGLAAEEAARDTAKAASGAAVPTGTGGEGGGSARRRCTSTCWLSLR